MVQIVIGLMQFIIIHLIQMQQVFQYETEVDVLNGYCCRDNEGCDYLLTDKRCAFFCDPDVPCLNNKLKTFVLYYISCT